MAKTFSERLLVSILLLALLMPGLGAPAATVRAQEPFDCSTVTDRDA